MPVAIFWRVLSVRTDNPQKCVPSMLTALACHILLYILLTLTSDTPLPHLPHMACILHLYLPGTTVHLDPHTSFFSHLQSHTHTATHTHPLPCPHSGRQTVGRLRVAHCLASTCSHPHATARTYLLHAPAPLPLPRLYAAAHCTAACTHRSFLLTLPLCTAAPLCTHASCCCTHLFRAPRRANGDNTTTLTYLRCCGMPWIGMTHGAMTWYQPSTKRHPSPAVNPAKSVSGI